MDQSEVQFAYTILYVKDVAITLEFYKKVFGFKQKLLTPEKDYGELISGTTTIAFASFELANSNFKNEIQLSSTQNKPFGIELAFTTQNIESLMQKAIGNGGILLEKIETKPWGQKVGYIKDINGFLIEICTPINS